MGCFLYLFQLLYWKKTKFLDFLVSYRKCQVLPIYASFCHLPATKTKKNSSFPILLFHLPQHFLKILRSLQDQKARDPDSERSRLRWDTDFAISVLRLVSRPRRVSRTTTPDYGSNPIQISVSLSHTTETLFFNEIREKYCHRCSSLLSLATLLKSLEFLRFRNAQDKGRLCQTY